MEDAAGTLDAFVPDLPRGTHPDADAALLTAFNQTRTEYTRAADRFTDAVRVELGVVPTYVVDRLRALVLGLGLSKLHTEGGLSCSIVAPS